MGEIKDPVYLILEDMPERAALMYQRMIERVRERTFWAQTAEEAIDILKNYRERLVLVSLDHDLGGRTYVPSEWEQTGMEVIRYLEKQNPRDYDHIEFFIHSFNIPAAVRMRERLLSAGYRTVYQKPFGS